MKKLKKIEEKNRVVKSARKLSDARDDIIDLFVKGTFPYKGNVFKTDNYKKHFKYIEDKSIDINYELFKKHFNFKAPTVLAKKLCDTKDKKKNNELVNVIKSGLIDLKGEIEKMSEDEKKKY